jgi:Gpi18-like mannosyltransferase
VKLPRWIVVPLLAFVLSRLFIFGVGLIGDSMLQTEDGHTVMAPDSLFLSMWSKWDSQYYVDIATNGYWYQPDQQSNVAFFPVYPLLMRLAGYLIRNNLILAGFLISNLAFWGALVFLYRLTALEIDEASAGRVVFYLAFFPTSFFFNCVYTESTFMLLALATVYFSRRHLWAPAALVGMFAAATRNLGILLWALVLWEWLRAQGWSLKTIHLKTSWIGLLNGVRQHWFDLIVISIIPLGLFAYMYFLRANFDRPLAFIETQASWGRQNIGTPAVIMKNIKILTSSDINKGWLTNFWNLTTLFVFLGLVPFIWMRLGEGYALYVLVMLLVPSSSSTGSMIRYVLTAFPAFMLLGWWGRRELVNRALMGGMAVGLGLFVTIFVNWVFVG